MQPLVAVPPVFFDSLPDKHAHASVKHGTLRDSLPSPFRVVYRGLEIGLDSIGDRLVGDCR